MMGPIGAIGRALWRVIAVGRHVRLGRNVHIGFGSKLWAPTDLVLGREVYVGRYCTIECDGSIGSGTLIANNVGIVGRADHDFRTVGTPVSRAPWVGHRSVTPRDAVTIGVDVWIGFGAVVLSGVTVGRGAIIGAGAVVSHDVEEYAIVAGNPARRVGTRFAEDERRDHESALAARYSGPLGGR